jgi:hypothetical protein
MQVAFPPAAHRDGEFTFSATERETPCGNWEDFWLTYAPFAIFCAVWGSFFYWLLA